jgi:hypothetical protein
MAKDFIPDEVETVDWGEEVEVKVAPEPVATEPESTTQVLFKWVSALNDPIQYKPQSGTLIPQEVFIAVDVPNKYILERTVKEGTADMADNVLLTLAGYAWVQNTIAATLLKSYEEFKY